MENLLKNPSVILGSAEDIADYQRIYINNIIGEKLQAIKPNIKKSDTLYINAQYRIEDVWKRLERYYKIFYIYKYSIFIFNDNFIAELHRNYNSSHTGIVIDISSDTINNTDKYIQEIKEILKDFLVEDDNIIEYTILQYDNSETLNVTSYQDSIDIQFNPLAVPFIDDVDSYIDNFLDSKSHLLILQGEPGTGKTTFIKYMLSVMAKKSQNNTKVLYSFDENILYISDFYKKMIYDQYDIIILEDINHLIHRNLEDTLDLNSINKFLSVIDGLITKDVKVVITTNIESKTQLYPALIRPGRCFDIASFRPLQNVEIDDLCDSCAKDLDLQRESINISEFYAQCNDEQNKIYINNKIGF